MNRFPLAFLVVLTAALSACSLFAPQGGPGVRVDAADAGEGEGESGEGEGEGGEGEGGEGEGESSEGEGEGGDGEGEGGEGEGGEGEGEGEGGEGDGTWASPIAITLPFHADSDSTNAPAADVDTYSCAPDTDESGREIVYTFTLAARSTVNAHITEAGGEGTDVDVHLLSAADADTCLARGNRDVTMTLDPGTYFLVVDTWVDEAGPHAGPYALDVTAHEAATGNCAMRAVNLEMVWGSCTVPDCFTANGVRMLHTPTTGPVVKEAHLVTTEDDFGDNWPTSFTDGISAHYALSSAASGYAMTRHEPWAPAGEGGSEFGQGSSSRPPVLDEAWYINMYWRDRPAGGTRMIVRNPVSGAAVVASAGWETGPGDNDHIGGVTEEIHDALGTGHLDTLEIGFAEDATLPLGPIVCDE